MDENDCLKTEHLGRNRRGKLHLDSGTVGGVWRLGGIGMWMNEKIDECVDE